MTKPLAYFTVKDSCFTFLRYFRINRGFFFFFCLRDLHVDWLINRVRMKLFLKWNEESESVPKELAKSELSRILLFFNSPGVMALLDIFHFQRVVSSMHVQCCTALSFFLFCFHIPARDSSLLQEITLEKTKQREKLWPLRVQLLCSHLPRSKDKKKQNKNIGIPLLSFDPIKSFCWSSSCF